MIQKRDGYFQKFAFYGKSIDRTFENNACMPVWAVYGSKNKASFKTIDGFKWKIWNLKEWKSQERQGTLNGWQGVGRGYHPICLEKSKP